jgi:hypothetical protein
MMGGYLAFKDRNTMKRQTLLLYLLIVFLAACTSRDPANSTPQGQNLLSTPTPHSLPEPTPTPEIFNPLNPSPTPSTSDLPMTCQITDLKVQVDRAAGYCFAYPERYHYDAQPMFNVMAVQGPPVGSSTEPVSAAFYVETSPAAAGQSLEQQVDSFLKDFTAADPVSLGRTALTLDGEDAILVDQIPGYLSWRIVFAIHDGVLYRLMYWPVDVPEVKTDLEELYQTTLNSFAFIPSE